MIIVTKQRNRIILKGHANYAPIGQDIVCAGVSTLVQALIQSIEVLTADKIEYDMSPGTVDIKFGNLSEQAQLLIDSFFIGVKNIADEYPDHVRLTKH